MIIDAVGLFVPKRSPGNALFIIPPRFCMHGLSRRTWTYVLVHFLIDAALFFSAAMVAMRLRFGADWTNDFQVKLLAVLAGALILPCSLYVLGLYGRKIYHNPTQRVVFKISLAHVATVLVLAAFFYFDFSSRIGRGVMAIGLPLSLASVTLHHLLRRMRQINIQERVALLIGPGGIEMTPENLEPFLQPHFTLIGAFSDEPAAIGDRLKHLGTVAEMPANCARHRIERILCAHSDLAEPQHYQAFTQLRYTGVAVLPLIHFFEEVHQYVPLPLVTPDWLLVASGTPEMFYIKKLKRAFDISASLGGLLFLGPVLLIGILLVALTSRGPIFYRQTRVGRFGRLYDLVKLRTMRVDAEKDGAVWAAKAGKDPRATPVGSFLRRYRIDEIPQIFNVLRGEMSFVGPRPERPEFVRQLDEVIPFNRERLMVQPGITGWAQVCYPYGASVEDAKRKLEFDLYYLKHMGWFLDLFILLDTIRIVLKGGLGERTVAPSPRITATPFRGSADPFPEVGQGPAVAGPPRHREA